MGSLTQSPKGGEFITLDSGHGTFGITLRGPITGNHLYVIPNPSSVLATCMPVTQETRADVRKKKKKKAVTSDTNNLR